MICLSSILLSRLYVIWVYEMNAIEVGISLFFADGLQISGLIDSAEDCIHYS